VNKPTGKKEVNQRNLILDALYGSELTLADVCMEASCHHEDLQESAHRLDIQLSGHHERDHVVDVEGKLILDGLGMQWGEGDSCLDELEQSV
jgi:hypothetical protein